MDYYYNDTTLQNTTKYYNMTDSEYNKNGWHNHKKSATINSVIYLQIQDKGISFRHNNKQIYLKPNNGDMLIFPAFLDHYPVPSKKDKRISINLELICNENEREIFNVH